MSNHINILRKHSYKLANHICTLSKRFYILSKHVNIELKSLSNVSNTEKYFGGKTQDLPMVKC